MEAAPLLQPLLPPIATRYEDRIEFVDPIEMAVFLRKGKQEVDVVGSERRGSCGGGCIQR